MSISRRSDGGLLMAEISNVNHLTWRWCFQQTKRDIDELVQFPWKINDALVAEAPVRDTVKVHSDNNVPRSQ